MNEKDEILKLMDGDTALSLRLLRLFMKIKDKRVRLQFVSLMELFVETQDK